MNKTTPITIDGELARIFGKDARSFYAANHMTLLGLPMPKRYVPLPNAELAAKVAETEPQE